eukprot:PhF_6_TR909/c2_g2_i1/m.1494
MSLFEPSGIEMQSVVPVAPPSRRTSVHSYSMRSVQSGPMLGNSNNMSIRSVRRILTGTATSSAGHGQGGLTTVEDMPWPVSRTQAFHTLKQIGSYVQVWYDFPRHSMQRYYGVMFIKHTFQITIKDSEFIQNLKYDPSQVGLLQQVFDEAVTAWEMAQSDGFSVDHKGKVIPALLNLSRVMSACEYQGDHMHSTTDSRIPVLSIVLTCSIGIAGIVLNSLLLVFEQHYALQALGYLLIAISIAVMFSRSKVQGGAHSSNYGGSVGFEDSIEFNASSDTRMENPTSVTTTTESNSNRSPHGTIDVFPVLGMEHRDSISVASDDANPKFRGSDAFDGVALRWDIRGTCLPAQTLSDNLFLFAIRKHSTAVTYWSAKCEETTGFPASKALGTPILAMMSESSRGAFQRNLIDDMESLFSPTVVFLSDLTLTVTVQLHRLLPINAPDTTEVFYLGHVVSNNSKLSSSLATCIEHMQRAIDIEISTLSQGLDSILTPAYRSAFAECTRLIKRLHTNAIQSRSDVWSTAFRPVHMLRLLGEIVNTLNDKARKNKIRIVVNVAEDFPEETSWDEGKLRALIEIVAGVLVDIHAKVRHQVDVHVTKTNGLLEISFSTLMCVDSAAIQEMIDNHGITLYCPTSLHEKLICAHKDAWTKFTMNSDLSKYVQLHEDLGGRVRLHAGGALVIEMPYIPCEGFCGIPSMEDSLACFGKPEVVLTFVLYEPNPVYRMQVRHFLWSRGHCVITCHDVTNLITVMQQHKWAYPIFDIDSDVTVFVQRDIEDYAESRSLNFCITSMSMTTTFVNQPRLLFSLKPFVDPSLLSIERHALQGYDKFLEHQSKMQHFKQLFSEHRTGQWTKLQSLGKGSFGEVFLANNELTGGKMAVKMLSLDTTSPQRTADLINEIDILWTMEHPNIIHYFYCERGEDTVNIFMEYCPDGTLHDQLMKSSPALIPHRQMARYLKSILSAVVYIHSLSIVHRDIKAANILFSNGVLKLADFGVSTKLKDGKASGASGTLRYMAPEVFNEVEYTEACDIWSVGCVLLEMVTGGEQPFSKVCPGNKYQFMTYITECGSNTLDDGSLNHGLTDLHPDVSSFLTSCLQVDPALRSTASTLLSHPLITKLNTELVYHEWQRESASSWLGGSRVYMNNI